ncbi:uncharacterized protein EKO05_0006000 [Ascochyta rabiei]|uniref:Uncharacterized protein n=1 Tax=Didymella rabiei TaxID=5454 RepID=A0A163M8R5_DIDRA|nr:uncharacterized protein EKO05_0006000 [Ascochyta rabiei]KZM28499.1 hypothetical protein ST47_g364 [Ascochyta rabiei]UPX15556.1 hypothetical protein EKO05_0006000 [Ascochyta rabiei]
MSKPLQIATYIMTWTSFPSAIASCMLRCYCCKYLKRSWKADDVVSLVVGVSLVGALGIWQRILFLGCAGPAPNVCNYSDPSGDALIWLFVTSIYYALLHYVVRTAFFTLYLPFSAQSRFRFWIGMGFGMNFMVLIIDLLLVVFQCNPITAAFKPAQHLTAQCMDRRLAFYAPAVLNALLNLYVLVLPLPMFWSIQMPTRRKIYIFCLLTTGTAAVALGFIRIDSLRRLTTNIDTSAAVGEMMIVAALGMSLAAITHNLPSMRIFWRHVSKSRSNVRDTSYRPCNINSRDKLQATTTYWLGSAVSGLEGSLRHIQPTVSVTSPTDRPLPAVLMTTYDGSPNQLRYPVVDLEFGMRPRTPPRIF